MMHAGAGRYSEDAFMWWPRLINPIDASFGSKLRATKHRLTAKDIVGCSGLIPNSRLLLWIGGAVYARQT